MAFEEFGANIYKTTCILYCHVTGIEFRVRTVPKVPLKNSYTSPYGLRVLRKKNMVICHRIFVMKKT